MAHYSAGQMLTASQVNTIAHQGISLLQEVELESATSTVTFSSIEQTAKNLLLIRSGGSSASAEIRVQFNGDTGSNYLSYVRAHIANDTNVNLYDTAANSIFIGGSGAADLNNSWTLIPNYSRTDRNKPLQSDYSKFGSSTSSDVEVGKSFGRWSSTAAITQIDILVIGASSHNAGSVFQLYGLGDTSA